MLNEKLRAARKHKRWSIETAAEEVGVSWVTYSRWERGEQQPHPTTLDMLCDTFGMPPGELGFVSENNLHETESDEQMKRRELIKRIGYTRGCTRSQAARFSLYLVKCCSFCLARRVSISRSI